MDSRTKKAKKKGVKPKIVEQKPISKYPKTFSRFAAKMRERRVNMKIRLGDCARQIGVTYNTLYCWEHGKHSPATSDYLDRWCAVLGVSEISINDVNTDKNG
jgi:DNA-binding XRE family transcriptional regulator